MASVTVELLNPRQLLNLKSKNKDWVAKGLVPNDGNLYHHCGRCEDLGIAPKFKRIEHFTFYGSRADGVSGYCSKCLASGLTKEESFQALQLMQEAMVPAENGELMLRDYGDNWVPVSAFTAPKQILKHNLSHPVSIKASPKATWWQWAGRLVGIGLAVGAIAWAITK